MTLKENITQFSNMVRRWKSLLFKDIILKHNHQLRLNSISFNELFISTRFWFWFFI